MDKEKKILDLEINNRRYNYLYYSIVISEELKAIQRSIALLRQDLPKIVQDELAKKHFNGVNLNKNES